MSLLLLFSCERTVLCPPRLAVLSLLSFKENANQGRLLSDIQEIDARFYVFQSDHRRLWNEAMDRLQEDGDDTAIHRKIEARTTKWGDKLDGSGGVIDLISGSAEFSKSNSNSTTQNTSSAGGGGGFRDNPDGGDDGEGFVDIDVFGPGPGTTTSSSGAAVPQTTTPVVDPFAPISDFHDPFAPPAAPPLVGTGGTSSSGSSSPATGSGQDNKKSDTNQDLIQL